MKINEGKEDRYINMFSDDKDIPDWLMKIYVGLFLLFVILFGFLPWFIGIFRMIKFIF